MAPLSRKKQNKFSGMKIQLKLQKCHNAINKCLFFEMTLFFVSFRRLVRVLLDEVMTSTVDRCVDPVLMEHSVSHMIVT